MPAPSQNQRPPIEPLIDRILSVGSLSVSQHFQLVSLFLSDLLVTEEERRQINRVFDELLLGRLKWVKD